MKEDREGKERKFNTLHLQPDGSILEEENTEMAGSERAKLFPTDIGTVVTDFLQEHFPSIMDFQFTAKVEQEFDDIAAGKDDWQRMVKAFYNPFNAQIQDTTENAERASGERELGVDPASGKMVLVRIGRYGPLAQIGAPDEEEKRFASLLKGQTLEGITLEEALKLFELPPRSRHVRGQKSRGCNWPIRPICPARRQVCEHPQRQRIHALRHPT